MEHIDDKLTRLEMYHRVIDGIATALGYRTGQTYSPEALVAQVEQLAKKQLTGELMEKRDRFLLEEKIMDCWNITNDIETVIQYIGNIPNMNPKNQDRVLNMLIGMKELYHFKFECTLDLLGELVENKTILNPNENTSFTLASEG